MTSPASCHSIFLKRRRRRRHRTTASVSQSHVRRSLVRLAFSFFLIFFFSIENFGWMRPARSSKTQIAPKDAHHPAAAERRRRWRRRQPRGERKKKKDFSRGKKKKRRKTNRRRTSVGRSVGRTGRELVLGSGLF